MANIQIIFNFHISNFIFNQKIYSLILQNVTYFLSKPQTIIEPTMYFIMDIINFLCNLAPMGSLP